MPDDDDDDDDFDFMEHNRLQQEIVRQTLQTKPDDVTSYEIWARQSGATMQLQMKPPFELSDEAVAAIREMFLFTRANGQDITGMHMTFTETDSRSWQIASDYEYN